MWTWPVAPAADGRRAVVTQEFRPESASKPHLGVDIMFRRQTGETDTPAPNRGAGPFFVPEGSLAVAIGSGRVKYAELRQRGHAVRIELDDGKHDALYAHLADLRVTAGAQVQAGQVLGELGGDPIDTPQQTVHLHFEVRERSPEKAIDPVPFLGNVVMAAASSPLLVLLLFAAARMVS